MEYKDKIAYEQLLRGIQSYVDKCLAKNKEITTTAKVVEINEDEYTIELNGVKYNGITTIGGTCSLNEMVRVMIPQGQYNNMFILKGGDSESGGTTVSGVSSVNGKTGDVILDSDDVGAVSTFNQETIDIDFSTSFS